MSPWKSLLLSGYYYASLPGRARRNARLAAAGSAPAIVLFYHRIADDAASPWTMSNRTFEKQIRWLKRHFDLVSLAETQRRVRSGENHRASVTITFDDGYADNCQRALPLLIEHNIPCTYFVTTEQIFHGKPFPHDALCGRPLEPNTRGEICSLAAAGIEIGGHTRTHADLGRITDRDQLYDEMAAARDQLIKLTGQPIRYFAFPYGQHGNLSPEAFELAREIGYEGVCSAYGGFNFPHDDAFHLQRIHADNEMIRLKNWVTLDPHKLARVHRYDYMRPYVATGAEACA